MSQILILNQKDIDSLLTLPDAIESIESAYIAKYNGTGTLFPAFSHEFFSGAGEVDVKSAHLRSSRVYGLKLVSWFSENPDFALPERFSTSLLFDDATGEPMALLNASGLAKMRTGAATAISVKYLARKDASTLLVVGMGDLAPYLAAAAVVSMPSLQSILLYNPHGVEKAWTREPAFSSRFRKLLEPLGTQAPATISIVEDLAEAVKNSDVIITATPSRIPLIQTDWVRPGTHFCAVGADMEGKQELDSFILSKASIFVDDRAQAVQLGESEIPLRHGIIRQDSLKELGECLLENSVCRQDDEEITVYDATGIALQDLSIAKRVYDLAIRAKVGAMVEL